MQLSHNLTKSKSHHRIKRVGIGQGSGRGSYSGRGRKGQKARGSGKIGPTFTGGENSLSKSAPKLRGFKPRGVRPATVTLQRISQHFNDGDVVNVKTLLEKGFLERETQKFKVVNTGELTKNVTFDENIRLTKSVQESFNNKK